MEFIDLKAQQEQILPNGRKLKEVISDNIQNVLDHGRYILGPEVEELELILKNFTGAKYCIATASGTDALLIALMALNISNGDEVITTPFSFISTSEVIELLGAKPVFVDIDPNTYNINPNKIEEVISTKTKAILPVSLYGQPANFIEINLLAKKYNLPVIEDAAQSFGSTHNGKFSCTLSTIGTTSFFPSKPFGCYGDGGACFTNNNDLAAKIRKISRHGQEERYIHSDLGINGRIDTLQAAILLAKFPLFKQEIISRQNSAEIYNKKLKKIGINSIPTISQLNTSVYAQYTIQVDNRKEIQSHLKKLGIPTAVHYPTILPDQPALGGPQVHCKFTEATRASKRVLSLPMHPYLSQDNQEFIVNSISKII
ncbi:aminotransferase DegT [bacterium]|nr:aminotransferase DegT [bacterium]